MHVALLGTGVLGRAVAERLQATGHSVTAYNRTRATAESLASSGISIADSPFEAIKHADCTLLFLTDAPAIRSLLLDSQARSSLSGRTIVQMGTIGPDESRGLHQTIASLGGDYFEAPVLGSVDEAKAGTLLIMVGGTQDHFQRVAPVFRSLSKEPRLVGPIGEASTLKLALNQLIAAETAAFSLSLALIERSQVPVDLFMSVLKESALFARTFDKKLRRLQARNYDHPNFSTRHLLKDVELFLSEARERQFCAASLLGVRDLLKDSVAHGFGEVDYSAMHEEVSPRAGPEKRRIG